MKKYKKYQSIILSAIIMLLLASSVFAGDLSVNPSSETKTANINEKISSVLRISNSNPLENINTALPFTIVLKGTRNNESVSITYNTSSPVAVPANSIIDLNYSFNIPTDAFSEAYTGIFNFTSGSNSTAYALSLNINPSPQIKFSNISRTHPRGYSRTYSLAFENTGNTDLSISLGKNDLISQTNASNKITADKLVISSSAFNLLYKETKSATLDITIPLGTPAETYTGDITVTYAGIQQSLKLTIAVVEPILTIEIPSKIDFPTGDHNTTQTATFDIKNTGNIDLTNIKFTTSADIKYNSSFNSTQPFTLNAGEIKSLSIKTLIPLKEKTELHSIGNIKIQTDQKNFTGSALNIAVLSKLEIDDMDFIIKDDFDNKDSSDSNLVDGDTVDVKAKPTSKITMEFKIKNKYTENSNIDFNGVTITATIRDIEDGENVELESDDFDIDAGKLSSRVALEYDIPVTAEDETYQVDIVIEGEDDNNIVHTTTRTIFFKVDKRSKDIAIKTANIFPDIISCDRKVNADIKLVNAGKDDEDDAKVTITNDAIGVNQIISGITLKATDDEDENTFEKTSTFFIGKNVPAGTYPLAFKVFISGDVLFALQTKNIVINDCAANLLPKDNNNQNNQQNNTQNNSEKKNDTIITPPEDNSEDTSSDDDTIIVGEQSLMKNPFFIAGLFVVNAVVLIGIIFLIAKVMMNKQEPGFRE